MAETQSSTIATKDQVTGVAERIIYGLAMGVLMKFVGWGWLTADMAPYVATGIVTLAGGAYAWWINRPQAILQAAGNVVGEDKKRTVIITSPEPANSVPSENVVSNQDVKVTSK